MKRLSRLVLSASVVSLVLVLGAGATPAPIPNASFTDGTTKPTNWSVDGDATTFFRDTSVFRTSPASLRLEAAPQGGITVRSDCFPVSPSTTYYTTYFYRATSVSMNEQVSLDLRYYDDTTCTPAMVNGGTGSNILVTASSQWQLFPVLETTSLASTKAARIIGVGLICPANTGCQVNVDDVSMDTTPTAVVVSSLAARRSSGGVDVTWRAGTTAGVLGFNVWRSGAATGTFTKLNPTLIPALSKTYRYRDATARAGKSYVYKLQLVRPDGTRRWVGTVSLRAVPA